MNKTANAREYLHCVLKRNPGATESSVRSELRDAYRSSSELDAALAAGEVVRRGHKLYLAGDAS